jgi:ubiquinone/menaquinone biosynthesis C-methylase UbiE
LAKDAYALAMQRCRGCHNFHALWPYLRIGRISSGVEGGRAALAAAIHESCTRGSREILITGAADTGILCLAAQASKDSAASFVVIDVCDTPLELCRRFAKQWNLRVETKVADVTELTFQNRFDIVIAHSLLHYLRSEKRVKMFSRIAAALKPDGKFLQVFNTGHKIRGATVSEYRDRYPDWVLEQLEARNIDLPEVRSAFRARLAAYAEEREQREGVAETPEEILAMMRSAGFSDISCRDIELNLAAPYTNFVAKLSKRRYLSIASISP